MSRSILACGLAVIGMFSGLAQGAVVNMNFSDTYDGAQNLNGTAWSVSVAPLSYAGTTWNGSKYAYSGDWTGPLNNLLDSEGNAAGVGFTMAGFGGVAADWSGTPVMLKGGFYTFTSMTLTIKGLSAAGQYDLYLAGNANNGNSTTFTIGSVSQATSATSNDSWVLGDNYVQFTNLTPSAQGEISVVMTGAGKGVPVINGFQLANAVPEPASLGLIGLSGLLFLRRKRH